MLDVAIVGGGLAGLSLAAELAEAGGIQFAVFEASHRLGGRILCTEGTEGNSATRFDLGPTWIWPHEQTRLRQFIQRHGIEIFPQYKTGAALYLPGHKQPVQRFPDPQGYGGAYRIQGGVQCLIDALLPPLASDSIHLQHRLLQLTDNGDHIELRFLHEEKEIGIQARRVVLCLPPRLLAQHIRFAPALDDKLLQLFSATPTWMAGHAKMIIQYERAFWRDEGLSGNAFARYPGSMLGEIFDACDATGQQAAIGGFFLLPPHLRQQYRDDLEALVLEQLVNLFGPEAARPVAIYLKDWYQEPGTAVKEDAESPQHHPQYGHPWLRLDHWDDKLFFASTESDQEFGGYLEGALNAAARVAADLIPGGTRS